MPADPRNAGSDKGKLEQELRNWITALKLRKLEYEAVLDELTKEELLYDLNHYERELYEELEPYLRRAEGDGREEVKRMARELKELYESIVTLIRRAADGR
ncbi:MAG: hypothetical protein GXO03_00575 [Aquificae bacterium]|nr:hypothetical protein [Aquificota bacterium]